MVFVLVSIDAHVCYRSFAFGGPSKYSRYSFLASHCKISKFVEFLHCS